VQFFYTVKLHSLTLECMGPFKDYHATDFAGLTNTISNRTHDSWSLGRDLKPGPPTNVAVTQSPQFNKQQNSQHAQVRETRPHHIRGERVGALTTGC
jgi:hypothetical protein